MQLGPDIVDDCVSTFAVEAWLKALDQRDHLFPEKTIGRHKLNLTRGLQLIVLSRPLSTLILLSSSIKATRSHSSILLLSIACSTHNIILAATHKGVLDLMNIPLELIDPSIPVFDTLMVISLDLFDLGLIHLSLRIRQLVIPFGFDQSMQLIRRLVWVLVFE